ncbi:unnamed protein product [Callosobruchus maculatus]|uniref:Uncharacterized protein n=1 Tax=Callosobruchus maculatus TaxID=64391 RepID=A0A653BT70_CALMS|nr:unnamed protein product [Callosobruchus maculatus]
MAADSGDKCGDIADVLMSITDDQAQFSDIDGDSEAEDGLVLDQQRSTNQLCICEKDVFILMLYQRVVFLFCTPMSCFDVV